MPDQENRAIRLSSESKEAGLKHFRGGFIPHWLREPKTSYDTINAKVETVAEKPFPEILTAPGAVWYPLMAGMNGAKAAPNTIISLIIKLCSCKLTKR